MINATHDNANTAYDNAYAFTFTAINGAPLPLADFKGKVILLVNTASRCGFTEQYAALEQIYEAYKDQGLVVVGVPSNDFGGQEPGSNEEIASFCQLNYGVSFPLTRKELVSGKNAHPCYRWAYARLGFIAAPKWNFHKYLIDRHGQVIDYFYSITSPRSERFNRALLAALHDHTGSA